MFLGIDIGTSGVKVVAINDAGCIAATTYDALPISRPKPTWSEQNPQDWWKATCQAVAQLDATLRSQIQGIGLTGQMHGAVLLDASDKVLRPAILWNDGRSAAECAALQNKEPDFIGKGGNLVMPGFTAPKLEWVRRHEPKVFEKTAKVLLPKDYIRFMMTGEYASDMSDSAGTLWMDVSKRQWHAPLIEACGLELSHMPTIYEGTEVTGTLHTNIAAQWGVLCVPVYGGGGDNAAGAIGAGVVDEGDTLLSLGTSGVLFTASETYRSNPLNGVHAFCHAVPDRWHLMSVMLSAASCLDWACKLTGTDTVADLIQLAETSQTAASEVLFLPYLSGERTPHNDPQAKGVLFGLGHDSGPAELAQAVLEGVAFGLADGLDVLMDSDIAVKTISVVGGGSQSPYWGQVLASALGKLLIYRDGSAVGPAYGAARLAAYGASGSSLDEAFDPPEIVSEVEPNSDLTDIFMSKRARFSALYTHLKPSFQGQ